MKLSIITAARVKATVETTVRVRSVKRRVVTVELADGTTRRLRAGDRLDLSLSYVGGQNEVSA